MIGEVDVVYQTRIRPERVRDMAGRNNDGRENNGLWRYAIDSKVVQRMKPDALILHPLPRTVELDKSVDADPRAMYFRQAMNGLYVRMALLTMLLDKEPTAGSAWVVGCKMKAVQWLPAKGIRRRLFPLMRVGSHDAPSPGPCQYSIGLLSGALSLTSRRIVLPCLLLLFLCSNLSHSQQKRGPSTPEERAKARCRLLVLSNQSIAARK